MGAAEETILWGSPASQPSRAVYWTCLIKGLPFQFNDVAMKSLGVGGPIDALNPSGQVPTLQDGGFAVYEMPAILTYLCEKHGWDDLLPHDDLEARTRVNQYLHFHHNWTRRVTLTLMAPHVTVAFRDLLAAKGKAELVAAIDNPGKLEAGRQAVRPIAALIERAGFRDGDFLCGSSATIADIACYEELAQLAWAKLFDFAEFPKLDRWLTQMSRLPFHEAAHRYNLTLGDIASRPNTIERFLAALSSGVEALREQNVPVRAFD